MPIFLFKGRILPEFEEISAWNVPTVHFYEPPHLPDLPEGLKGDFNIAINHSLIDLICTVDELVSLSRIHNRAIAYVRAFVDLHCFATGAPLTVILDTAIDPYGEAFTLRTIHPSLANLCTVRINNANVPGSFGFGDVMDHIIREPALFLAMRDLISALSYADLAVVNCARAIEGLRNIMVPDENREKAWPIFQGNLNFDRAYREFVTKRAIAPRHGDRTEYITGPEIDEALQRSWKIMNRFLEFRRGGNKPLRPPDFDLLAG
ncbi:MAG TPA: hypothetical protein VHZ25_13435 [Acidobacteriaceae bacterium]|jgi:hypothetical protein|nr:hypothetical protein [Acidobacteriaceae bacterium]